MSNRFAMLIVPKPSSTIAAAVPARDVSEPAPCDNLKQDVYNDREIPPYNWMARPEFATTPGAATARAN